MKIFGRELTFRRKQIPYQLESADRGWHPIVNEPYTGAWQRNDGQMFDSVLSNTAVYRCVTLIASDVAKMRVKLVEQDEDGIWQEIKSPAFSPVIRRPNDYQTHIQFYQQWMTSKLTTGNTYVLKSRDERRVVNALYILDATRTRPLIAPDGAVYYQLYRDDLAGQHAENLIVPASEIIHDRMNPLFHPFIVGLPPIYASYLPAVSGLRIQKFTDRFFRNQARPSGILTAPGEIPQEVAERVKTQWEGNYSGDNLGKVAVAGSGLTWVPVVMNAVDSQLIEQLKLTAEQICSTYGVPAFKAGIGPPVYNNNVQTLTQAYYTDCVQIHVESIEALLDEGLGLEQQGYGTEFDLDNLLRMDTLTQTQVLGEQVAKSIIASNEARAVLGYAPKPGGDSVLAQQQNYSLEALAKRDAQDNPFAPAGPQPQPVTLTFAPPAQKLPPPINAAEVARAMLWDIRREMIEADAG